MYIEGELLIDYERELENQIDDWIEEKSECPSCQGSGGWDISSDPEVYDEWKDCLRCDGTGEVNTLDYDE